LRERLPCFEYHVPGTLEEATSLLVRYDSAVLIQGGTDLVVAIRQKGFRPSHVVSLKKLRASLSYVREDEHGLRIGAMTTISSLCESLANEQGLEVLLEGISTIGSYQIRNTATIGGNLCNASPAADSAPPLLALGASFKAVGVRGERVVPAERFFLGPGRTALERGEILQEISIPFPPDHSGGAFIKLGRREGEDVAIASAAAYVELPGDEIKAARIALGSVAPIPLRALEAEGLLLGKMTDSKLAEVADSAARECQPIDDVRASGAYRRRAVRALTRSAVEMALRRAAEVSDR
jgi:CO/xanthine dehydrogenase FAD-binding subunit